jgi:FG-GAP-like repeat
MLPRFSLATCFAVWIALACTTPLHAQLFYSPVNYDTGGFGPQSVALGDVNGDGVPDIVVANEGSDTVGVLLGNGDGTFQPAHTYPAGNNPYFVLVGAFGYAPHLAAAVANRSSDANPGQVTILLNNDRGGFLAPVSYGSYRDAFSLAAGRFRRGGKIDIAVADTGTGSLLLNNGDGTFRDGGAIGGTNPLSFAVTDLNRDHLQDLVAVDNPNSQLQSLLGNGKWLFSEKWSGHTSSPPNALVLGNFNHDRFIDVAVADEDMGGNTSNAAVFLGLGDGTFSAAVEYPVDAEPRSIAAGRLNRDGKIDLVTANQFAGTLSILLGNGDGTFKPAISIPSGGTTPTSVVIADLNGDGYADLVVAQPNDGVVSVLLGTGKKK